MQTKHKILRISSLIIRILIFLFIAGTMIKELMTSNYRYFFISSGSIIILFLLELIIKRKKLIISTIFLLGIYIFVLIGGVLGEVYHFYLIFPFWDILVHCLSGFILSAIGFSLIKHYWQVKGGILLLIFLIAFSLMGGVIWEFKEYVTDKFMFTDEQKDTLINNIYSVSLDESKNFKEVKIKNIDKVVLYHNNHVLKEINGGYLDIGLNDTMSDLFWDLLGSLFYSLIILLLAKQKINYDFLIVIK